MKPAAKLSIIASSIVSDDEILPAMTNDCDEIPKLLKWIEESDARLVVHMEWAVPVSEAVQESRCGLQ